MNSLVTLEAAAALVRTGRPLTIAGSEALLRQLPRGTWIGGTLPYFMGPDGAVVSHEFLLVNALPPEAIAAVVRSYDVEALPRFPRDAPDAGCTLLLAPGFSDVLQAYGRDAQRWPGLFDRPVVGWVSGVELGSPDTAAVIDGTTGEIFTNRAVALHVTLAPGVIARADLINIFSPGPGPDLTFPVGGFEIDSALIDGRPVRFSSWLAENAIDTRLPLIADYSGASINVSVQAVDAKTGRVRLFAPVFPEMTYRFAAPVADAAQAFRDALDRRAARPAFGCNCVLNLFHGDLLGKKTGAHQVPFTFGEIAYLLLNQTMVVLTFETHARRDSQPDST